MSRVLKCIGGVWDGRTVALQDGARQIVVQQRVGLMPFWVNPHANDLATYTEHLYVLDQVKVAGEDPIAYLRPAEWDGAQALRHVLGA